MFNEIYKLFFNVLCNTDTTTTPEALSIISDMCMLFTFIVIFAFAFMFFKMVVYCFKFVAGVGVSKW